MLHELDLHDTLKDCIKHLTQVEFVDNIKEQTTKMYFTHRTKIVLH